MAEKRQTIAEKELNERSAEGRKDNNAGANRNMIAERPWLWRKTNIFA
jgi:hypothetical protein